jgi:lipoate-protein ligase A
MLWRLINDGPGGGAWNMGVDEAILEACIAGDTPPTLRIYGWQPPAITLGHFQKPERALYLDVCKEKNLEVARRPTGGRAILHDKEITFSIIAPLALLGTQGVMDSYRYLAGGIIAALKRLGVSAELVERAGQSAQAAAPVTDKASPAACFAVKSRCDLMVAGKKIVGSAQVHRTQVVLQQDSLPFVIETEKWKEVFRGFNIENSPRVETNSREGLPGLPAGSKPSFAGRLAGGFTGAQTQKNLESSPRVETNSREGLPGPPAGSKPSFAGRPAGGSAGDDAIGLWEAAGRAIGYDEAALALKEGFAEALGIEFAAGELSESEKNRAKELEGMCKVVIAESA